MLDDEMTKCQMLTESHFFIKLFTISSTVYHAIYVFPFQWNVVIYSFK